MIYNRFDIVIVPFPFVDSLETKRRPALVLSSFDFFGKHTYQSILAMITSAQHAAWPCDMLIEDLPETGLKAPSIIRMKLFTLDHRLIIKKCGQLSCHDQQICNKMLKKILF